MRKLITTFALAAAVISSTSATLSAGGLAPVEVAPTVFVEDESTGSMGLLLPVGAALLVACLVLCDDDSSGGTDEEPS